MNKQIKSIILTAFLFLIIQITTIQAQVGINEDNSQPDASALLDVKSTDKGMLTPRMTTLQRTGISSPAQGLLVYDVTTASFWYFDNNQWNEIINAENAVTKDYLIAPITSDDFSCHGLVDTTIIEGIVLASVGNYLYTATDADEMITYDFSNRTAPVEVHRMALELDISFARNVYAIPHNNHLYIQDRGSFEVVNITSPNQPVSVADEMSGSSSMRDMVVDGNFLLTCGLFSNSSNTERGVKIYNISNPSNPILMDFHQMSYPYGVAKKGNLVYLSIDASLQILDMSNPANPTFVTQVLTSQLFYDLEISGNYLYGSNISNNTIAVYDISNPSSPTLVSTIPNVANSSADMPRLHFKNNHLYASSSFRGNNTYYIDDVTNAASPILKVSKTVSYLKALAFIDDILYVQDDNRFISVRQKCPKLMTNDPFITNTDFDKQTIDVLSLNGNTLEISLENDSEAAQTVDLSSLANSKWTTTSSDIMNSNLGNVGIGISPTKKLDVNGNGQFSADGVKQLTVKNSVSNSNPVEIYLDRTAINATQRAAIGVGETSRDFFIWYDGADRLNINESGLVGIGRTPQTNILEIEGQASKSTAGDWLANSDARLKKNIQPLASEQVLEKLLSLQGVTYEWNDTITGNNRPVGIQYGFTAQNIQTVFPTLVEADNLGYLQTAYGTYDAMYVEAFRALNDKVEKLEKENEVLKAQNEKINQLEAILQALQQQVNADKVTVSKK